MPPTMRPLRLLDSLRSATRSHHEDIDRSVTAGVRAWTIDRYARLLRTSYAVVTPVEESLCDLLGGLFAAPPPSSRAQRLRSDLAALGCAVSLADTWRPVRVRSRAEAFGIGYVLQGSLLGGAIISRQVRADCPSPSVQTTYLDLYGPGLSAVWSRFCGALDAFGTEADERDCQRAIDAAIETFDAYRVALAVVS